MEYHAKALSNLCRLCARRVAIRGRMDKGKLCKDYHEKILDYYEIDASITADYIPTKMCSQCYRKMMNVKKSGFPAKHAQYKDRAKLAQNAWQEHQDGHCIPCQVYTEQCKGGKQGKVVDQILNGEIQPTTDTQVQQATPSTQSIDYPPYLSCRSTSGTQPGEISSPSINSSPSKALASNTHILATTSASPTSALNSEPSVFRKHQDASVQTTPKGPFLLDCLTRNTTSPLTNIEARVTLHNVKRMLQYSSDGKTAVLPTGGKVRWSH